MDALGCRVHCEKTDPLVRYIDANALNLVARGVDLAMQRRRRRLLLLLLLPSSLATVAMVGGCGTVNRRSFLYLLYVSDIGTNNIYNNSNQLVIILVVGC